MRTDYFRNDVLEQRPCDRLEWRQAALKNPAKPEVQPQDGRVRHRVWVSEIERYLRVVTLPWGREREKKMGSE